MKNNPIWNATNCRGRDLVEVKRGNTINARSVARMKLAESGINESNKFTHCTGFMPATLEEDLGCYTVTIVSLVGRAFLRRNIAGQ